MATQIAPQKSALKFILLLGLVSLFGDMVYEGSRSIVGPFFESLGATGAVVGFVAGFGEFIGYGLRLISGYFVDRSEKYWLITFLGYGCLFAIPLLAFAPNWKWAAALIIVERMGKAIRTPARDAMLSYATQKIGRGVGFGLHQVFDQMGGMLGPTIMIIILFTHQPFSLGFSILFIPAIFAISILFCGRLLYPHPKHLEIDQPATAIDKIPRIFWLYLVSAALMAAGYADFPLIAFHFEKAKMMSTIWIPIFYLIAMGVSALSAMIFGWIYDRLGVISLMIAILLAAFFAPFVFRNNLAFATIGIVLWGIGMGAQRSLLKAIVGDIIAKNKRGMAFGIFNTCYGIAWFLGSWLMGYLYDTSVNELIVFSVVMEIVAVVLVGGIVAGKRGGRRG